MLVIDDDLESLKKYLGTNPIPNDFDEFWANRVFEAHQIPLQYEINENEIQGYNYCGFYDLTFQGIQGEKLYAKYLKPKVPLKHPLILQFHGYPGSSRSWFEQASFVGMGCAIIALDCPGQGGQSQDSGHYLGTTVSGHLIAGLDGEAADMYYVKLYQDICILVRIIQELEDIDQSKIYVNGASQGAGLATICAALNPEIIKKACILYPFLSDFQRVYDLNCDEVAYEGLRYYFKWFDPMHKRKNEIMTQLGYIDVHHFAKWIKANVLFGCSLKDQICPPSTQMAVYNQLKCPKEIYYFHDYGHEEISMFDDMILDFLGDNANEK